MDKRISVPNPVYPGCRADCGCVLLSQLGRLNSAQFRLIPPSKIKNLAVRMREIHASRPKKRRFAAKERKDRIDETLFSSSFVIFLARHSLGDGGCALSWPIRPGFRLAALMPNVAFKR
jgi:hypothetical protein